MRADREGGGCKARSRAARALQEAGRRLPFPQQWEGASERRNNFSLVGWEGGGSASLKLAGNGVRRPGCREEQQWLRKKGWGAPPGCRRSSVTVKD